MDPIIKTAEVAVPCEHVFEVFTRGLGGWWPVESHSVCANTGARPQAVRFEERVGGQIYELAPDGARHKWGEVTAWDPPHSVQFHWHPGREVAFATLVGLWVSQTPEGARLELHHTGWEVFGAEAEAMRAQYDPGWDFVFGQCFLGALNVPET